MVVGEALRDAGVMKDVDQDRELVLIRDELACRVAGSAVPQCYMGQLAAAALHNGKPEAAAAICSMGV